MPRKSGRKKQKVTTSRLPPSQIQISNIKRKSTFQLIWNVVGIMSVFLNFLLAYYALSPKVKITWNSSIAFDNPLSLPFKIENNSTFPIYDVNGIATHKNIKSMRRASFIENMEYFLISSHIKSQDFADFYLKAYRIDPDDRIISGHIVINASYKLFPFIPIKFKEQRTFRAQLDKNNVTHWLSN